MKMWLYPSLVLLFVSGGYVLLTFGGWDSEVSKLQEAAMMGMFLGVIGLFMAGAWYLDERKKDQRPRNTKSNTAKFDEGALLGGIALVAVAAFEIKTRYFADNFLVPYQSTDTLRNLFESGIVPIIVGLYGLKLLYDGAGHYLLSLFSENSDSER